MKRTVFTISFLSFVSTLFCILAQNKPSGLMTDLLKHTGTVFVGGYPSSIPLWQQDKAIEPANSTRIHSSRPLFGWLVPDNGKGTLQTAYRIIVSDSLHHATKGRGTIWDSGTVASDKSVAASYQGETLHPNTVYYWRVKTVTNTGGESEWSDVAAFRTGDQLQPYRHSGELLVKDVDKPLTQSDPDTGIRMFDFGKAAFGQLLLQATSPEGNDTLIIHIGEKQQDGRVDTRPGGTIRYQQHTLVLMKGTHFYRIKIHKDRRNTLEAEVKMPSYIGEVMPFRYAEIRSENPEVNIGDVTRETVQYPFDDNESFFRCDNDTLNQLWNLCKHTIKATSFTGVYVDGDRERIPYEADILINQLSHYAVDRDYSLARRSLEYILEKPTWPTEWILQAILIAWNDYLYTGDTRALTKNYEVLKSRSLMQLQTDKGLVSTTTGLQTADFLRSIRFHEPVKDIVDWPHGERDGFVFCDHNTVVNAFYYEGLKIMEKIATITGNTEDKELFASAHKRVYKVFNDTFFNAKRKIYTDGDTTLHASLHSNMFASIFGLVPTRYQQSVQNFIRSRGMACSVYGAQFLMEALYEGGNGRYAEQLLASTSERSWYNMIRSGSTVALEAWDIKFKPNLDWNHAWGAVPGNIITRYLLGIKPVTAGFGHISIRPHIYTLSSVESVTPTIRGSVTIRYSRVSEDEYTLTVGIPPNMQANIYLPVEEGRSVRRVLADGAPVKITERMRQGAYVFVGAVSSGEYTYTVTTGRESRPEPPFR